MHKKYNLLAPLMKKQKIKSNIVNAPSQIFSVAVSLLEFVVAICSGKLPEKISTSIYQWNLQGEIAYGFIVCICYSYFALRIS